MSASSTTIEIAPNQDHLVTPSPCHLVTPSPPLLPPGSLTLLLGEPGTGKSLLALDLAARLSRGLPLPTFVNSSTRQVVNSLPPASSLILSREDTPDTMRTRLRAANANLHFIAFPNPLLSLRPNNFISTDNGTFPLSPLTKHLLAELAHFKNKNPQLLIFDPLPAFLGTADSSSAGLIRSLLDPLLILAQHHNFAILAISHLNKSTHKKNPLHRSLGSLAYTALARSVLLLTPDNLSLHRRILIPLKNNHAPLDRALAFNLHTPPNTPNAQAPSLLWEPTPITDHPLLNPHLQSPDSSEKIFAQSQLDFALDFLQQTLSTGPVSCILLLKQARALGISRSTYFRAHDLLQIQTHHTGHKNEWLSHLPHHAPNPTPDFDI